MTKTVLADVAAEINREHAAVVDGFRKGFEHARRAGELLLRAKAGLRHGKWLPWLAANIVIPERTAQLYMQLASAWPELKAKTADLADLTIERALASRVIRFHVVEHQATVTRPPIIGEEQPPIAATTPTIKYKDAEEKTPFVYYPAAESEEIAVADMPPRPTASAIGKSPDQDMGAAFLAELRDIYERYQNQPPLNRETGKLRALITGIEEAWGRRQLH